MSEVKPAPKLSGWMQEHLDRYLATDGADGHMWQPPRPERPPIPTLLLTTYGRRTGQPFIIPLIYGLDGKNYVVIASKGGAPQHPGWYLNLAARPDVEVQVLARRFKATARTSTGAERAPLWDKLVALFPPYTEYQKKTEREIPVVVLQPV